MNIHTYSKPCNFHRGDSSVSDHRIRQYFFPYFSIKFETIISQTNKSCWYTFESKTIGFHQQLLLVFQRIFLKELVQILISTIEIMQFIIITCFKLTKFPVPINNAISYTLAHKLK